MARVGQKPFHLGRYEAIRLIAAGGMAEIYLGRHRLLGIERLVVLKRVLSSLAGKSRFVTMFLDEARIMASLHHANIVQILDVGSVDGSPFLTMEALKGRDVHTIQRAAKTRKVEIGIEHALSIAIEVCAGLHYAHEARDGDGKPLEIVHSDVSPHNIFVTYDGGVKLMDFGIAKSSSRQGRTKNGQIKGKFAYIPPEKYKSEKVDRRGDVFSLGVVLWELTTARRLYKRDSELLTMQAIVERDAVPPSKLVHDYPPELEKIVLRALSRDPEKRQPTAEALQIELGEFAREHKLAVSRVTLSRLMTQLFAVELEAWAKAQQEGNYDLLIDRLVEELRTGQTLHGETVELFDLDLDAISTVTRAEEPLVGDDTVQEEPPLPDEVIPPPTPMSAAAGPDEPVPVLLRRPAWGLPGLAVAMALAVLVGLMFPRPEPLFAVRAPVPAPAAPLASEEILDPIPAPAATAPAPRPPPPEPPAPVPARAPAPVVPKPPPVVEARPPAPPKAPSPARRRTTHHRPRSSGGIAIRELDALLPGR